MKSSIKTKHTFASCFSIFSSLFWIILCKLYKLIPTTSSRNIAKFIHVGSFFLIACPTCILFLVTHKYVVTKQFSKRICKVFIKSTRNWSVWLIFIIVYIICIRSFVVGENKACRRINMLCSVISIPYHSPVSPSLYNTVCFCSSFFCCSVSKLTLVI